MLTKQMRYLIVYACVCGIVQTLCPNGYYRHDDSCYKIIRTKTTWAQAVIYCRAMGSELVNLETASEDNFIHGLLETEGGVYNPPAFWVGGNDIVTEGVWTWATTHTNISQYTNWEKGQPDNYRTTEHCMELSKIYHWNWNDEFCENQKYFICERPSTQINGGEIIG